MMSAYPMMPALLTRPSIRPLSSLAAATIRSGAFAAVTSATTVATRGPISPIPTAVSSSTGPLTSTRTVSLPAWASPVARALPMPWPAPVMMLQ